MSIGFIISNRNLNSRIPQAKRAAKTVSEWRRAPCVNSVCAGDGRLGGFVNTCRDADIVLLAGPPSASLCLCT